MKILGCWLIGIATIVGASRVGLADDWPQWRGADRDARSRETGLLQSWPKGGPRSLWVSDLGGLGYSGPAIVGQRLVTMGSRQGQTYLICLNVETGKELWSTLIGSTYENNWGDGPRGTPTIDQGRVFAVTGNGDLICADLESGEQLWKKHFVHDFGGEIPTWGFSESVLVDGPKVICSPGGAQGAIVALDKQTGATLWRSADCQSPAQYSSIVPVDFAGRRLYVQLFMSELVAVDANDGRNVWQIDWPGRVAVIPTPIVTGTQVYVTSGYGVGCMLVDFSSGQADEVYTNKHMKNHHGGVILQDDFVFGHSDQTGWICQELETGEPLWRERGKFGKGAVTYADGQFYCLEEDSGTVALIDASREKWIERGRFKLSPQTKQRKPAGRVWTHPVIANGRLYLRDQELIHCFDISARQAARD